MSKKMTRSEFRALVEKDPTRNEWVDERRRNFIRNTKLAADAHFYRRYREVTEMEIAKELEVTPTSIYFRESGKFNWSEARVDSYFRAVDRVYKAKQQMIKAGMAPEPLPAHIKRARAAAVYDIEDD